jgi:hypothetical protein
MSHQEETMSTIKLAFAAAALTVGLAASASAMPVGKLGQGAANSAANQVEQVRLVCNRWGRCWRTGPYYGYGYGYRSYGWDRGYRRGWRHRY